VTTIPFVTTIKPYITDPNTGQPVLASGQRIPLIGPSGPLPANAYVLLTASSLLAQGSAYRPLPAAAARRCPTRWC